MSDKLTEYYNIALSTLTPLLTKLSKYPRSKKLLQSVIFLTSLLALRKIAYKLYYTKYYKYPPGFIGIPILGCLPSLIMDPKSFLLKLSKYNDITSIQFGLSHQIFINKTDIYTKLCKLDNGLNITKPVFESINKAMPIITLDGVNNPRWEPRRKYVMTSFMTLVNSKFTTNTMEQLFDMKFKELGNGDVWYPRDDLQFIVFNVAYKALVGDIIKDSKYPKKLAMINADLIAKSSLLLVDMIGVPGWVMDIFKFSDKISKSVDELMLFVKELIELTNVFKIDSNKKELKRIKPDPNNISYYLDTVINDNNKMVTFDEILIDAFTILIAATDTTAHSTEYGINLLCKHPEIQKQLYNELINVNNGIFNVKLMSNYPLLKAFVYETLRLARVIPMNPHQTTKNIKYNNYFIPKNTIININQYAIHENEKYNNSIELNLNYWLIDGKFNKEKLKDFIAFGKGIRDCVGQALAIRELYLFFAYFILNFEFSVDDPVMKKKLNKMNQTFQFILMMDPQIGINVKKRNKD